MNLNALVAPIIRVVTPAISASLQRCTGYATVDYAQAPTYATPVTIQIDVQPLSDQGLKHVDSLNIQAVMREVWADTVLKGVDRGSEVGGDLITFTDPSEGAATWLVHTLLEPWSVGWCHAIVVKQVTP